MIYKYDEPMIFPVRDLYDSGMMQSYLSAVQRQYEQSREDQKEFIKNFGDYISPWNTANKAWYDETMGKVSDMMNAAAAQGIDLTRSQEGRALLGNLMRNVDYAKLAGLKEAAKAGEMYQKAKQDAILKGTWNEDRERWALERAGLPSFEEYDPNIHGIWTRTAPAKFTTLFDATNPWFEGMKEGALTQKQVEDLGFKYNPNYDWTGVSKDRMRDIILQNTPGWMTSEDALYYYDVAKRELQALGNANPTPQQIQARLNENIETANSRVPYAKYDANKFALKEQDFRNDVALQNLKHRHAMEQAAAEGGGSGSSSSGGGKKGKSPDSMHFSTWTDGIKNIISANHPDAIANNENVYDYAYDLPTSQKYLIKDETSRNGVINKLSFQTPELNFKSRYTGRKIHSNGSILYNAGDRKRMITSDQLFDRVQITPDKANELGVVGKINKNISNLKTKVYGGIPYTDDEIYSFALDLSSDKNTAMFIDKDNKLVQYQKVRLYIKEKPNTNDDTNKKTTIKPTKETYWIKTDAESDPGRYSLNSNNVIHAQDAQYAKNIGGKWEGYGSSLDLRDVTSYGPTEGMTYQTEDLLNPILGYDKQKVTGIQQELVNLGISPENVNGYKDTKVLSDEQKAQLNEDILFNTRVPGFGTRRTKTNEFGKTIKVGK